MRFNQQRSGSRLPEVNLIPMMNVMMAILAFFVMIAMTLSAQQAVDIQLPSNENDPSQQDTPDPLVVRLNAQGQIVVNSQPIAAEQLFQQMQVYLSRNLKGNVLLQADQDLPYEKVVQLLGEMRDIGGDRVSLALEALETE